MGITVDFALTTAPNLWQISVKDKDSRQDMTAYWSMFSSLISYWLPSPAQSQSQFRSRKDD